MNYFWGVIYQVLTEDFAQTYRQDAGCYITLTLASGALQHWLQTDHYLV